jgi:hypothetical protein
MKILCLLTLALVPVIGPVVPSSDPEEVKLDYELLLNRCIGDSCHSESAAHGEVYIFLEQEDPAYSQGYSAVEQEAGSLAYQLRFNVSRVLKEKKVERKLDIGFSGRIGSLRGKQLTWSQKEFVGKNWDAFKMASTSGAAYPEKEETIMPTLKVIQVSIFP